MLTEWFYEHLLHLWFKLEFVKFSNSKIENFKNLFNILSPENMSCFSKQVKIIFRSVNNLVADRQLYSDFENNEREEGNTTCNFC